MEDKEIILRCLSGEIEIFEMLVIKYQTDILSMTWSVLGDKEEAKDVAQEAFIQTYLNLNRFDSTKSFRSWLYAIAYKRCLDRKRKERSLSRFIQKAFKEKNLNTEPEFEEKIYRPGGGTIAGSADANQISIYRDERRPRLTEKNSYLYDYQLIKKGEKIEESRTLLEEDGEKRNEKNAPLKTKRFQSEKSVFGPAGLLSRKWQASYDYKIAKDETSKGRETFVMEARPKIKTEEKPSYNKIWIDKKDFSILRIRIEQESLAGYDDFEKEAKKIKVKPILTIIHDYEVEKNGLMFPSKTTFREEYTGRGIDRSRRSELSITYGKYRFFIVETEVKYKSA
jgi:RNA polymerase sigma factor (sigma-70 family)